jgi:hypothetical protein
VQGLSLITKKLLQRSSLIGFIAFTLLLSGISSAQAQPNQDSFQLQVTNAAFNQTFRFVLDAENAGANVTNLLNQLNVAAGLLSQAENAFRTGDNETAAVNAGNVLLIVQQVAAAAHNAKQATLVSSQDSFLPLTLFTVAVAIVFVLSLFIVWRWFKSRYLKNLLNAKPEIID